MYIADHNNNRIRKVTVSTGVISTIAGTGTASYSGDNGAATSATLQGPYTIAIDSSGNLYIGDTDNHRVRKVTIATGLITTIAGTGVTSASVDDGDSTSATLSSPWGIALDTSGGRTKLHDVSLPFNIVSFIGNVFICDYGHDRIRKITVSTDKISTFVGTGSASYSGDGGAATSATLNKPVGVTVDSSGMVIIIYFVID